MSSMDPQQHRDLEELSELRRKMTKLIAEIHEDIDKNKLSETRTMVHELVEALRYAKRFIKPYEADMDYIDEVLEKAKGFDRPE